MNFIFSKLSRKTRRRQDVYHLEEKQEERDAQETGWRRGKQNRDSGGGNRTYGPCCDQVVSIDHLAYLLQEGDLHDLVTVDSLASLSQEGICVMYHLL